MTTCTSFAVSSIYFLAMIAVVGIWGAVILTAILKGAAND